MICNNLYNCLLRFYTDSIRQARVGVINHDLSVNSYWHTEPYTYASQWITGGAVAQPCVNSYWLSQWKPCIFDPHRIDVP